VPEGDDNDQVDKGMHMNEKQYKRTAENLMWLVFSIGMFFSGLWVMDVSATAIINGLEMTTLLVTTDPLTTYHVGLILVVVGFLMMTLLFLLYFMRDSFKRKDGTK
jgi:hypothetical protein